MQRILWILAAGSLIPAVHAQCPVPNFLQAGTVTVLDDTSVAGIQRQADGSFTRQRFKRFSPYTRLDSTADFQSAFQNCTGAGIRAFQNPPGWVPLSPQPGAATQTLLFSNFLGNGTIAGLAIVPGGLSGGPTLDSCWLPFSMPTAASRRPLTIRFRLTRAVCWWRTSTTTASRMWWW